MLNLGLRHLNVLVILYYYVTSTHGSGDGLDAANWMQQNLHLMGNKPLKEICIPGSHDAGMSKKTGGTAFASECNTLTQTKNIKEQLELGARYFDIRPVVAGGVYKTGHYSLVKDITWQGANGQTMEEIIQNINEFTSSHNELVILKLSHSLNTDGGNTKYREFNDDEWEGLLKQIMNINHRFEGNHGTLIKIPISEMITNRSSVIALVDGASSAILDKFNGRGVFPISSLKIYDNYSNTEILEAMANDQIDKLRNHSEADELFLLSWTLTQSEASAVGCVLHFCAHCSIIEIDEKAKCVLATNILPEIIRGYRPNIIYIDNVSDNLAATLSVACLHI